MAKGKLALCVAMISDAIAGAVTAEGFAPVPEIIRGGMFVRRFRRDGEWKTDVVDMSYKRGAASYVGINLCVCFRVLDGNEHYLELQSLQNLVGRGLSAGYHLTTSFGFVRLGRCRRLARRIAVDLGRALPWFGERATPEQCLQRLRSPETLPQPGSPIFAAIEDHLGTLLAAPRPG
jgi:hypothetical protein